MKNPKVNKSQRLSEAQKRANNFQWYKEWADSLEVEHDTYMLEGSDPEKDRMRIACDLFNNKLHMQDLEYVTSPYGKEMGELPARMVNRDISSGKIKALIGIEEKYPFEYNLIAVNPEATTQREKEEFGLLMEYLNQEIMVPLEKSIEEWYLKEYGNGEMSPEEKKKMDQQVAEEVKAKTPEEVKKYMEREYQDPSEVMHNQLLDYLVLNLELRRKFNDAFKWGLLTAKQIGYVGIENDDVIAEIISPLRFSHDKSPDSYFIEDSEWGAREARLSPTQVVAKFPELTDAQIDRLYEDYSMLEGKSLTDKIFDNFDSEYYEAEEDEGTIKCMHYVWKSLRPVKFLKYLDENRKIQELIVADNYKFDRAAGDLTLEKLYLPTAYETWKIGTDIYLRMQQVPGQHNDINNLRECKLPYCGVIFDNFSSAPVSAMDRLKVHQYKYNVYSYKLELLTASDKGKKVLMNINLIPDELGIDVKTWSHFMESTPYMWYNPNEEGSGNGQDATTAAKVIDLSLASDMNRYIELCEYTKQQAGLSIGVTPQMEAQISERESVQNVQTVIANSSNILEPYFNLHNIFKRNFLNRTLTVAKACYSKKKVTKLSYILDDMSKKLLELDLGLLDSSTVGIFLTNSTKITQIKDSIDKMAFAAMQNNKVEMSDVMTLMRQDNLIEAEEQMKLAENARREFEQLMSKQQGEDARKLKEMEAEEAKLNHEREKELIILKEEEKRKTEFVKGSMMGASFNPDVDKDNDGKNDFVEMAQLSLENDLKKGNLELDKKKFEHQKIVDKEKNAIEKDKVKAIKKQKNSKS